MDYKIKHTEEELKRIEKAKEEHHKATKTVSTTHRELRQAILHPWCNRCNHIINFHCNCTINYNKLIPPSGFEPREQSP